MPRCTTRQRNTHNTESREVRYPWHPWCGRTVTVYEALTKGGHAVCWCGFDDQRNGRSLEVPTWMFDPSTCDHLRLDGTPTVSWQALLELKVLLETAQRGDMLPGQHRSLRARRRTSNCCLSRRFRHHRSYTTGATELRGHDGQVQQGEQGFLMCGSA